MNSFEQILINFPKKCRLPLELVWFIVDGPKITKWKHDWVPLIFLANAPNNVEIGLFSGPNSACFCVLGHFSSHWVFCCEKCYFCPKKWRKVSKTKLSSSPPILMHDAPRSIDSWEFLEAPWERELTLFYFSPCLWDFTSLKSSQESSKFG